MRQLTTTSENQSQHALAVGTARTLLVDAENLFKRSFMATQNSHTHYNASGVSRGALYQFMMGLRKHVRNLSITKVVLCWDGENGGILRHHVYELYKANRENKTWSGKRILTPAEAEEQEKSRRTLLAQRMRIKQYCEELFIRQIEFPEIEGDDLIAAYVASFHQEEVITILSSDADFLQLLSYPGVRLQQLTPPRLIDLQTVGIYYDWHYANAALVKILCGDTSDNIYGIVGLGTDTLLKHFPEIRERPVMWREIVEQAKIINATRVKEKKKPLAVLENIVAGRSKRMHRGEITAMDLGEEFFEINQEIIDLTSPMIRQTELDILEETATAPLESGIVGTPSERSSRMLQSKMREDGFLELFNGTLQAFTHDFHPMIIREKTLEKLFS